MLLLGFLIHVRAYLVDPVTLLAQVVDYRREVGGAKQGVNLVLVQGNTGIKHTNKKISVRLQQV